MTSTRMALLGIALVAVASITLGSRNRQRIPNRCSVPRHNYRHDETRPRASAVCVVETPEPGTVVRNRPNATDPADRKIQVRVKRFPFPIKTLTLDHITLSQVGITLYEDGTLLASGRIRHDGGPNGDLRGNDVTVRLRAYAGNSEAKEGLEDEPSIWQSEMTVWITKDDNRVIQLTPSNAVWMRPACKTYFNETTHIEVEIEYREKP